jgi:hypothetical protein
MIQIVRRMSAIRLYFRARIERTKLAVQTLCTAWPGALARRTTVLTPQDALAVNAVLASEIQ